MMRKLQILSAVSFQIFLVIQGFNVRNKKVNEDASYWNNLGLEELTRASHVWKNLNTNIARNVILFIGDGMSLPTQAATRIYKAQKMNPGALGEEYSLSFEKFPHMGLSKVYSVDAQSPDSASTASAMLSGVKTNYYCVGFDNSCVRNNTYSHINANKVKNMMSWAQESGRDTGFVTTSRVSHATPSAMYAHSAYRKWECDSSFPAGVSEKARDITWQLVNKDPGRRAKVVLGGGKSTWLTKKRARWSSSACSRTDGLNLIDEWLRKNESGIPGFESSKGTFIETKEDLLKLNLEETDYLLGLFSDSHMSFEGDENTQEPTLSEMTETAIKILERNEKGFFLMVEGANIDRAHHKGKANRALMETSEFDNAIEMAMNMTSIDDTLIIVTADHGHGLHFGAYETRGVDVRGPVDTLPANDGKSIPILSYSNGLGFDKHFSINSKPKIPKIERKEMKSENWKDLDYMPPATIPLFEVAHSAADVGIFARGPYAHLFHSIHEQSYIGHVMAFSSCVGPYKNELHCTIKENTPNSSNSFKINHLFYPIFIIKLFFYK